MQRRSSLALGPDQIQAAYFRPLVAAPAASCNPPRAKLQKAEALKAANLKGRESTKSQTDSTKITKAEKAKALKHAQQNEKGQWGVNEGDKIDPQRQIGEISSQATCVAQAALPRSRPA